MVIIGERPSLASAVADLLEAERIETIKVPDIAGAERAIRRAGSAVSLVVCACGRVRSEAFVRWKHNPPGAVPLVLIGAHDPEARAAPGIHTVHLPLEPRRFLRLVLELREAPRPNNHRAAVHASVPPLGGT